MEDEGEEEREEKKNKEVREGDCRSGGKGENKIEGVLLRKGKVRGTKKEK